MRFVKTTVGVVYGWAVVVAVVVAVSSGFVPVVARGGWRKIYFSNAVVGGRVVAVVGTVA